MKFLKDFFIEFEKLILQFIQLQTTKITNTILKNKVGEIALLVITSYKYITMKFKKQCIDIKRDKQMGEKKDKIQINFNMKI